MYFVYVLSGLVIVVSLVLSKLVFALMNGLMLYENVTKFVVCTIMLYVNVVCNVLNHGK